MGFLWSIKNEIIFLFDPCLLYVTKCTIWRLYFTFTSGLFSSDYFLFVRVEALRPSQQFFSHVETEPLLPGYYQYFLGGNVSCSRIQHVDLSEDRTPDLSLRSATLYHKATAPPS